MDMEKVMPHYLIQERACRDFKAALGLEIYSIMLRKLVKIGDPKKGVVVEGDL